MDIYDEAELYRAAFDWPLLEEVDWLVERFPGTRRLLEPFCGTARYAGPFAHRGIDYYGVDLSESMLSKAPEGDGITTIVADARSFEIPGLGPGGFDLAWCPINSISHLHDEQDLLAHLRCVRRHLKPGGTYVVELELVRHDGVWHGPTDEEKKWAFDQPDGSVVEGRWSRLSCDLEARTAIERPTFRRIRDGRVIEEVAQEFTMRMWTYDDLIRIPTEAGFRLDERAFQHRRWRPGPQVAVSREMENTGQNHFFFLHQTP